MPLIEKEETRGAIDGENKTREGQCWRANVVAHIHREAGRARYKLSGNFAKSINLD